MKLKLLLSLVLFAVPAVAHKHHGGHHHHETVEVDVVVPEAAPGSAEETRNLLHEAHEAMEGDDEDMGFFRRWLAKTNVAAVVRKAHRFYLHKSGNIRTRDHAANMVTLFGISHGTEMLVGGMMASYAISAGDLPWWARAAIGVTGVGITVPGFDPLCYLLFGTYFKFPQTMNKALYVPRVVLVYVGGHQAKLVGAKAILDWMISRKDGAKFLIDKLGNAAPGIYHWSAEIDHFDFAIGDGREKPRAQLTMLRDTAESLYLEKLVLDVSDVGSKARGRLNRLLRPFGGNVKAAVLEVFDAVAKKTEDRLPKRFYVTKVERPSTDEIVVSFGKPTIRIGPHRSLRHIGDDADCKEMVSAKPEPPTPAEG